MLFLLVASFVVLSAVLISTTIAEAPLIIIKDSRSGSQYLANTLSDLGVWCQIVQDTPTGPSRNITHKNESCEIIQAEMKMAFDCKDADSEISKVNYGGFVINPFIHHSNVALSRNELHHCITSFVAANYPAPHVLVSIRKNAIIPALEQHLAMTHHHQPRSANHSLETETDAAPASEFHADARMLMILAKNRESLSNETIRFAEGIRDRKSITYVSYEDMARAGNYTQLALPKAVLKKFVGNALSSPAFPPTHTATTEKVDPLFECPENALHNADHVAMYLRFNAPRYLSMLTDRCDGSAAAVDEEGADTEDVYNEMGDLSKNVVGGAGAAASAEDDANAVNTGGLENSTPSEENPETISTFGWLWNAFLRSLGFT